MSLWGFKGSYLYSTIEKACSFSVCILNGKQKVGWPPEYIVKLFKKPLGLWHFPQLFSGAST